MTEKIKILLKIGDKELDEATIVALNASTKSRKKINKSNRNISTRDKTQVNIRELFRHSVRCHICGGIVNLSYGGLQYDHVIDYAVVRETSPDNLNPTHPFCNNQKHKILKIRNGDEDIKLPEIIIRKEPPKSQKFTGQLSLFWGTDAFPE